MNQFGGNLRLVLYGAAPMNKETIIGYNNLGIELVQGYGLKETSPVLATEKDKEKRPGAVGIVFDSIEVKIEDPDENGIGEIVVKGPNVMLRILQQRRRNQKSITKRMA